MMNWCQSCIHSESSASTVHVEEVYRYSLRMYDARNAELC